MSLTLLRSGNRGSKYYVICLDDTANKRQYRNLNWGLVVLKVYILNHYAKLSFPVFRQSGIRNREDKHINILKQFYMVFSLPSASHYIHTPHLGSPFKARKKINEQ